MQPLCVLWYLVFKNNYSNIKSRSLREVKCYPSRDDDLRLSKSLKELKFYLKAQTVCIIMQILQSHFDLNYDIRKKKMELEKSIEEVEE